MDEGVDDWIGLPFLLLVVLIVPHVDWCDGAFFTTCAAMTMYLSD